MNGHKEVNIKRGGATRLMVIQKQNQISLAYLPILQNWKGAEASRGRCGKIPIL